MRLVCVSSSRGLRVSHVPLHIRGADAQAAYRRLFAAAPRVIIDYGKPYDDDSEFRPNPLTPKHFTAVPLRGFQR